MKLDESNEEFKNNLGKRVVIDKDTLTITDYSLLNDNYVLSNGSKISYKLIGKLKIIK